MRNRLNALHALPIEALGRRPDVLLAVAVAGIVAMLLIPLPSSVLDVLISVNIALSVVVLMGAVFAKRILDIATFPTLLLLSTLFRLGLNVSTTRGVLSRGEAGKLVEAFGEFVVQGDIVVGLLIFLVVTLVQLLVIAKGSERVAEIAARFTLDAMPGKQMSIDAALRNGALTEEEAEAKRIELGRESSLFGNMDGAMKFVKGDAIAGLIITALNLVAGVAIGVLRNGLPLAAAVEHYSVLTIGDALAAQVSSLLVTLAAGILMTRIDDEKAASSLGGSLMRQLFGNDSVLGVSAALMALLGLIPGLPVVPFLLLASVGFGVIMIRRGKRRLLESTAGSGKQAFDDQLEEKIREAKAQKALADRMAPSVVPIALEINSALAERLGFGPNGESEHTRLVASELAMLR
ncbi:MAG: FHIPEP family type III secretion protein, partial [Deltaproteobacteria bacterium]|nr:FHIPEP family type III secretion protein [Deltaproteobacteria bacterium]